MKLQRIGILFVLPAAALFLSACGGSEQESTDADKEAPASEADAGPATIDEAIARGNIEVVKAILAKNPAAASVGARPTSPPLHQAILRQKGDIALVLVEAGADVNAVDSSDRSPLHLCVERDLAELVAPLVEAGASPNAQDPAGWTPLHLAGAKDRVGVAAALLENGADIDVRSNLGGTPLHEAAASGSKEIVQLFLDAGVDVSVVAEGGTALDIAKEFENGAAIELLSGSNS
ncbi:MAG: ankyrin repeat domain-containing protein [Verrucomicrobiota bacterium]